MKAQCLLNPVREKSDPIINGPVLMCINPGDARALGKMAVSYGARKQFLFNSSMWQFSDKLGAGVICGPAVGAPMAVMVLEKVIALGARDIIVFGCCGSLQAELAVGDILMPNWAMSEEGTSDHYPVSGQIKTDPELSASVGREIKRCGYGFHEGPLWTTDAPYRETVEKVARYQKQGIAGVDMEYAALLTVAAFRQVEIASVMVVSDQLSIAGWLPGFNSKSFKQSNKSMRKILFDLLLLVGGDE